MLVVLLSMTNWLAGYMNATGVIIISKNVKQLLIRQDWSGVFKIKFMIKNKIFEKLLYYVNTIRNISNLIN